ncbi:MAG TPA: 1-deoxy-D-xylulose-5-phosphate reductoisomerase [Acidimicrobiia bacterium]|nr:1-deoxy-D-xylulose-5-phosphate reductoisomerase [Acidimicrobiia bacterium]
MTGASPHVVADPANAVGPGAKALVVLGATGSIGTQTLEVADSLGIEVAVLAARRPSERLAALGQRYPLADVVVAGGPSQERTRFDRLLGRPSSHGSEAVIAAAAIPGRVVVNGIVGSAGLRATVAALEAGNRVALANKESLVAGGPVVTAALADHGGELIPVDSEHSALFQCLEGEPADAVSRLILTASGGPFRGRGRDTLADATPEEALDHPTWDMGKRISIDSATMFNKGLEIVEAHFLFGVDYDRIDVVVHPQSILHSAVEFVDGSWKGHLGRPDMRIPIQYALTAPQRAQVPGDRFDPVGMDLTFEEPDREVFGAIDIAYEAGRAGGSAPAVMNAADEMAVEAFLQGRLGFLGITDVVARTIEDVDWREVETVDDVLKVDAEARSVAAGLIAGVC